MTNEEKEIAIHRACGKKACDHHPDAWKHRGAEGDRELFCTLCNEYLSDMRVPHYTKDLNAMHEAEKRLVLSMFRTSIPQEICCNEASIYFAHLIKECGDMSPIHATAAQRAEAFGKTLNLW